VAQLMPLPLTVSCFSKIQIGFTFVVPAHPGSPGQRAVKWVCVCVCLKSESRRYYKSKIFYKIRPPGNGLLLFVAGPPVVPAAYSRWWIITRTILLSLLPLVLFAVVVTLLFWLWRRRVLRSMHQHTASHADSTTPAVLASPYRALGPIQLLEVKVFSNCIYCLSTLRLAMCVM